MMVVTAAQRQQSLPHPTAATSHPCRIRQQDGYFEKRQTEHLVSTIAPLNEI